MNPGKCGECNRLHEGVQHAIQRTVTAKDAFEKFLNETVSGESEELDRLKAALAQAQRERILAIAEEARHRESCPIARSQQEKSRGAP